MRTNLLQREAKEERKIKGSRASMKYMHAVRTELASLCTRYQFIHLCRLVFRATNLRTNARCLSMDLEHWRIDLTGPYFKRRFWPISGRTTRAVIVPDVHKDKSSRDLKHHQ
jgi:hypothetical protein